MIWRISGATVLWLALFCPCAWASEVVVAEPCDEDVRNPVLTYWVKPEYPVEAREEGWEGAAIVKVLVQTDGTVGAAEVIQSTGHEILDEAALSAASQCLFEPGRRNCIPTEAWMALPFNFRLGSESKQQ